MVPLAVAVARSPTSRFSDRNINYGSELRACSRVRVSVKIGCDFLFLRREMVSVYTTTSACASSSSPSSLSSSSSSSLPSSSSSKSEMFAFRSFRQAQYMLRALRIAAVSFQSMFLWIIFICTLKHVRVASSSAGFEKIDADHDGGDGDLSSSEELESGCETGGKGQIETVSVVTKEGGVVTRRGSTPASCDATFRRTLAQNVRHREAFDGESSTWQTHLFVNSRRQTLFTQSWTPRNEQPMKGLLVLLHGLNEHSGRYVRFAMQLNSQGYGVYAMDWIGHGGSDGLHGYVPSLDHVVADTKSFLLWVKDQNPGVPCFIFGHSTGGAVVLKAASHPSVEVLVEGVIMTSPALRVRPTHPMFEVLAPVFSMLIPTFQFKGANRRGIPVTRDPVQLLAKYSDPLVYTGPLRVRTGSEILRITSYLQRNQKRITVPFLVMHGTADRVTDPYASQDLYYYAASKQKQLKLYEGYLHDLLFEPERDEITQDIIKWMNEMLCLT